MLWSEQSVRGLANSVPSLQVAFCVLDGARLHEQVPNSNRLALGFVRIRLLIYYPNSCYWKLPCIHHTTFVALLQYNQTCESCASSPPLSESGLSLRSSPLFFDICLATVFIRVWCYTSPFCLSLSSISVHSPCTFIVNTLQNRVFVQLEAVKLHVVRETWWTGMTLTPLLRVETWVLSLRLPTILTFPFHAVDLPPCFTITAWFLWCLFIASCPSAPRMRRLYRLKSD